MKRRRTTDRALYGRHTRRRLRLRIAYEQRHPVPQYVGAFTMAFLEADGTELDKIAMTALVLQARRLAKRPIRHKRLERLLWVAYLGLVVAGSLLLVQWLNDTALVAGP